MNNKRGFTLIELLVVIAIIGLLASIVMVQVNKSQAKAKTASAIATIKEIQTALELYYHDYGVYPMPSDYDESNSSGWCGFDLGGEDTNNDGEYFVDFLKQGSYLSASVKSPDGMSFVYSGQGESPCECMGSGVQIKYMLTVYGLPRSIPGLTDTDQCEGSYWNYYGGCMSEAGDKNYCIISQ